MFFIFSPLIFLSCQHIQITNDCGTKLSQQALTFEDVSQSNINNYRIETPRLVVEEQFSIPQMFQVARQGVSLLGNFKAIIHWIRSILLQFQFRVKLLAVKNTQKCKKIKNLPNFF